MHALSSFHSDQSCTVGFAAKIDALMLAAAGVTVNRLVYLMASPTGALACRYFGVSSELAIPERAELAHSCQKANLRYSISGYNWDASSFHM